MLGFSVLGLAAVAIIGAWLATCDRPPPDTQDGKRERRRKFTRSWAKRGSFAPGSLTQGSRPATSDKNTVGHHTVDLTTLVNPDMSLLRKFSAMRSGSSVGDEAAALTTQLEAAALMEGDRDLAALVEQPSWVKHASLVNGVVAVFYIGGMAGIAILANRQKKKAQEAAAGGATGAHFGGSFSAPVLAITTCCTIFSGYTVEGIPKDAATFYGFAAFRWYGAMVAIVATMMTLFPRLRLIARERGYEGPNDFIVDRYRSFPVRVLSTVCGSLSSIVFLTVQMFVFGKKIAGLTGSTSELADWAWRGFLAVYIVVMEQLGGLTSIVYTDVAQGCIMLFCFIALPVLLGLHCGFLPSSFKVHLANKPTKEYGEWSEKFEPAPSAGAAATFVLWWNFLNAALPINFHLVQRCYASKNLLGLKVVLVSLLVAGLIAYTPGVYMGLTTAAYQESWKADLSDSGAPPDDAITPFGLVVARLQHYGVGEFVFTAIMQATSVAAIMSTADSIIMGVSAAAALEMYKGWVNPSASTEEAVRVGEIASVIQLIIGVVAASQLNAGLLSPMLAVQNGLVMQVLPAYLLGMFTGVTPRAIIAGIVPGLLAFFILLVMYKTPTVAADIDGKGGADPEVPLWLAWFPAPAFAFLVNLLFVCIFSLVPADPGAPTVEDLERRFGPPLTPEIIKGVLHGHRLPSLVYPSAMLFLVLAQAPLFGSLAGDSYKKLIGGLPVWSIVMLTCSLLGTVIGMVGALTWDISEGPDASSAKSSAPQATSSEQAPVSDIHD